MKQGEYISDRTDCVQEKPTDIEIGGKHYISKYQPVQLIEKVRMFFCCGNIIKYIFRHKNKSGKQDLLKALHYCDLLESLGENWYMGTSLRNFEMDASLFEFYQFIKDNPQLNQNQIRAILAIQFKDMETLKYAIQKEIDMFYNR